MDSPKPEINIDIVILGGGIAGLWLLNYLRKHSYSVLLFEANQLGSAQTIASQGMIHGGIKYALSGMLTGASEAIADMPHHWRSCLAGNGDVDLTQANILSESFYLWSNGSVGANMKTFFASKATRGRVDLVSRANYPPVFQHESFKGSLYQLQDIVLDVPSVVQSLFLNYADCIYKFDWHNSHFEQANGGKVVGMVATDGQASYRVNAQAMVFTAGQGNEAVLKRLDIKQPHMQRRPLKQVIVKHTNQYKLYAHCMGNSMDASPRLTISSHPNGDDMVWYLGGDLATNGVHLSDEQLIAKAQQELDTLFPWLDFNSAQWATYAIDRAEPKQRLLLKPDKAFVQLAKGHDNLLVAWPTKLTLAPNLAIETLTLLQKQHIVPKYANSTLNMIKPAIAATVWSSATDRKAGLQNSAISQPNNAC